MTIQEVDQACTAAILEEAQARLLAIRAQQRASVAEPNASSRRGQERKQLDVSHPYATTLDSHSISSLPKHLGWGSQRQTDQIRNALASQPRQSEAEANSKINWIEELVRRHPPSPLRSSIRPPTYKKSFTERALAGEWYLPSTEEVDNGWVRLHPTIGLGILSFKLAAPGRIWLLLRWIDKSGSGWIDIQHARHLFCDEESPIQICSWRHLRSLLAKGEERFWNQREGRIWLRSIPKIAYTLQIKRLSGYPVRLPIHTLLQSIGQVRAHLYAGFHSGRDHANPISRAALRRISQVSARSQQNYEKRTKIRKRKNYAIGSKLTDENAQNQGWRHGSACFEWHDHEGRLGKGKNNRLAWQLPNSYSGPHKRQPRGRQRQINHELAVLSNKGMTGNDQFADDWFSKRYFDEAAKAIRTLSRTSPAVYWRSDHPGQWFYLNLKSGS